MRLTKGRRVQGTYKRGGNISTATYNLVNTGIQERNFSVGVGQDDTLQNVLTVRGAFPAFDYRQVDAQFWGVDLTITYNPSERFELTSKLSMVRAKDTRNNMFMVNIPFDRIENTLQYNFKKRKAYTSLNQQFIAR